MQLFNITLGSSDLRVIVHHCSEVGNDDIYCYNSVPVAVPTFWNPCTSPHPAQVPMAQWYSAMPVWGSVKPLQWALSSERVVV